MGRLRRRNPNIVPILPAGVMLLGLVWPAGAQTTYMRDEPGIWQPWRFQTNSVQARQVPAAEQRQFEARLQAIGDVIRQLPFLSEPKGFNPRLTATLDWALKGEPLGGIMMFGAFMLYKPGPGYVQRPETKIQGNGAWVNTETRHLMMAANYIPGEDSQFGRHTKRWWKGEQGALFLEPEKAGEIGGYPLWSDFFVIKNHPRELWAPAPAERVWKAVIAERKELADGHEDARRSAQRNLEEFLRPESVEQRRVAREKRIAAAEARGGRAALRVRADEEAAEKRREEELRARANPDPAKGGGYWDALNALRTAEQALAGLSAEQRQEPVCYIPAAELDVKRGRVVPPGTPGCQMVMQRNPEFFDTRLPRHAIQVLVVSRIQECREWAKNPRTRDMVADCAANLRLVDEMDWRKVAALLDQ